MSGLLLSIIVVAALSAVGAGGPTLCRWCARASDALVWRAPRPVRAAIERRAAAREAARASGRPNPDTVERVLSLAELRRGG